MINLYYNNAYKWKEKNNIFTIGYVIYKNVLYEDEDFLNLVINLKDNIKSIVKEFTGYFAIVIQNQEETILISDIIRSFPVFYTKNGDITDDISLISGELNELSLEELLHCRWISFDDTIYKNAQIVVIKKGEIYKEKYFNYQNDDKNTICSYEELDKIYTNIVHKMFKYLNGKTAVIPLSGGQDSRLLLYYTKKLGYKNIISYTYGNKNSDEVKISKKVAEFLDVKWYFIEYKRKDCRQIYNKDFPKMADYFGRGYSIPCIQEVEAIRKLKKDKILNDDCVIIPGFTMDFLAGNHLSSKFIKNEQLSKKILKEEIYKFNYNLSHKENNIFDKKLEEKFNICFDDNNIDIKSAVNIFDTYDFEERQAKYVTNAIRVYDYYGLKWYLPFWDKEIISFWSKVSIKDRYQRKFFINFVNYKYLDLMKYAPVYKKETNVARKNIFSKLKYIILKYYNDPLNFYYYFKYSKYLKYAIIQKNTQYSYFVANDYVKYIKNKEKRNGRRIN